MRQIPLNELFALFRYVAVVLAPVHAATQEKRVGGSEEFSKQSRAAMLMARLLKAWPDGMALVLGDLFSSEGEDTPTVLSASEFKARYRRMMVAALAPESLSLNVPSFFKQAVQQFRDEHCISPTGQGRYFRDEKDWPLGSIRLVHEGVQMILVRPRSISNESGRGYVLRISEQNGLETPRWLLPWLGEKGIASKGYAALGLILGNPEPGLDGLRGPVANLADLNAPDPGNLPIRYWNTRRPRFCPCCLAESPHWRASWDLVFTVACDKHGHQLHDRCPQCQKPLSWDRSHISTCPCGFDLREATPENAPEFAMQLAREIELRLQPAAPPQAGMSKLWHRLDLETLLKLVWFLGAYSRNAHRKPQKIVGLETKLVAELMVEQAMAILCDWPAGFHRLLDEIAARRAPTIASNKIGTRFGGFYSARYKSFSGPEFEFLRSGFEDYLRERWTGQLARRNRRLSADLRAEHGWVSIAEAAKQLKVRAGK